MPLSPSEILGSSTVAVVEKLAIGSSVRRLDFRMGLPYVITGRAGYAVLVRTVVNGRRRSDEMIVRRRRRGGPLERIGFPGISAGFFTPEDSSEESHRQYEQTG